MQHMASADDHRTQLRLKQSERLADDAFVRSTFDFTQRQQQQQQQQRTAAPVESSAHSGAQQARKARATGSEGVIRKGD